MICVVLPISRKDYLKPVFDSLAALHTPEDTQLLIITDGDHELERAVDRRLDSIHFSRIQVVSFGDSPAEDIDSRRYRISAIHNKARHLIPEETDYVMLLEDDTTYPPNTLTKFIKTLDNVDSAVFVEGVELGRHNSPYVGGWKADSVYKPNEFLSVMPNHGIQNIDAGGLYCCLVEAELYRMHQFEPWDKEGKNGLSCDVNFGLYLRQMGYDCFIDWSIQLDHIGDRGSVNLGNTKPVQIIFQKKDGKWLATTL